MRMIDSLNLNSTGKTSAILSFPFPRHLHILLQISPGCECARFPCSAPSEMRWQSSCTEAPHWLNSWVTEKLHIHLRMRIFSTDRWKLHSPALSLEECSCFSCSSLCPSLWCSSLLHRSSSLTSTPDVWFIMHFLLLNIFHMRNFGAVDHPCYFF